MQNRKRNPYYGITASLINQAPALAGNPRDWLLGGNEQDWGVCVRYTDGLTDRYTEDENGGTLNRGQERSTKAKNKAGRQEQHRGDG